MVAKGFQRNTRQRQVILDELRKLTSHPTPAALYEIVRQRLPKISLGTVYRNLELLTEMELIQKLELSGAEARFDGDPKRHVHVRCIRCGCVDDLHDVPPDVVKDGFKSLGGYEIVGYRFEFVGICSACGKQQPPEDVQSTHENGQ